MCTKSVNSISFYLLSFVTISFCLTVWITTVRYINILFNKRCEDLTTFTAGKEEENE